HVPQDVVRALLLPHGLGVPYLPRSRYRLLRRGLVRLGGHGLAVAVDAALRDAPCTRGLVLLPARWQRPDHAGPRDGGHPDEPIPRQARGTVRIASSGQE